MIRNYINGAPLLTLAVEIDVNAVTLEVDSTSGFPPVPFVIAMERGTTNEEVVLCTAKTATTFTVTRGWDGTTKKNHSVGAAVEHTTAAIDYVEANQHHNSTGDVHPQYVAKTAYNGKGMILIGTGASTFVSVQAFGDNSVMVVDSAQPSGVRFGLVGAASLQNNIVSEAKLTTQVEQGLVSRQASNPTAVEGRINFRTDDFSWYGWRGGWRYMTWGARMISWGTGAPSGGHDGDIWLRYG